MNDISMVWFCKMARPKLDGEKYSLGFGIFLFFPLC